MGFGLIAATIWGLYWWAGSEPDDLALDQFERLQVKQEQQIWLVQSGVGLLVTFIAVTFMSSLGYLAGILFSLSPIAVFIITRPTRKRIRTIQNN